MELLIYIALLVGAVIGFIQGAFKQIAHLAGVAVGLVLASVLYERFGDYLAAKTGATDDFGHYIAFVLIVIVVPIVLGWLATLLTALFKKMKINFLNRVAGALIGLVSYALILSFAFNMFDFIGSNAGFKTEKLSEKEDMYYTMKHATQIILPDFFIVTDSTEIANGAEPKYGLKPVVDDAIDRTVDKINPFKDNE